MLLKFIGNVIFYQYVNYYLYFFSTVIIVLYFRAGCTVVDFKIRQLNVKPLKYVNSKF